MKITVLLSILLISTSAFARRNFKYSFINIGVPYTKLTSESDTVNSLDNTTGMAFHYGKRLGKSFAIELGYLSHSFKETEIDPAFPATFESTMNLTEITLGYQWILTKYWAMRMGYSYSTLTRNFSETGLTPSQVDQITYEKTFHTFYFGMVASVKIVGALGMYFDFLYSSTDAYNKTSLGAGLQLRF